MKIYETCPWTSDSRFHVRAPRMVQQKVAFFSQQLLRILLARKGFQRAVRTCLGIRQFRRMPKATRSAVTKAQTVIVIRIVVINTGIAQGGHPKPGPKTVEPLGLGEHAAHYALALKKFSTILSARRTPHQTPRTPSTTMASTKRDPGCLTYRSPLDQASPRTPQRLQWGTRSCPQTVQPWTIDRSRYGRAARVLRRKGCCLQALSFSTD